MTTGLDGVDWGALEHAYGAATDVPRQIRSLSSADAGIREAALDALYGNLWHQGTLYPATPVAIPFLLALIDDDQTPDRALLLLFLADTGRSASFGDDPWHADTLDRLQAGIPVLERRLGSADEVERIAAIVALAWADDGAVLAKRLAVGDDEGERLVALYALAAGRTRPDPAVLERFAKSSRGPSRLAAQIGLMRAGLPTLRAIDPDAYAVLAEVAATVAPQALPQPVELLDPASTDAASLRALARVLAGMSSHRTAPPLIEFLLQAALPDGYEEPPSPLQKDVLVAIATSPGAWVYGANTTNALAVHGLEVLDRSDLCARLGLDHPDRPEREDTATLLATSEDTGVRFEELSRTERDLLERFVDALDTLGWNDTRNWHKFVTGGSGFAISPIGVGRHFNERAVLECTLWLFDEHVAADTGERTGDPYVRLTVSDKADRKAPIGFRAYCPPEDPTALDGVLRVIDRHRPTLDRDSAADAFLHELFTVTARVEVETSDGRVLEIRPRARSTDIQ
ncbi:MAG: hypothetical protein ABMB14_28415 [Myxococcota bacterium]